MWKSKLANNYGYSLIELIMAIAIISITSSIAIPNYFRYIEIANEKVCFINRQSILYEYQLYCICEQEITLSDYISIYHSGEEDLICPSEGTYTASGSGETAELTCLVHREGITGFDVTSTPLEIP